MGRLIDLRGQQPLPSSLTVRVGDLLVFGASGARVPADADALERLGPFVPGVVGTNGQVLSPMGAPNAVLFLARGAGTVHLELVTGDPFHGPRTSALDVTVEP